MPGQTSPSAVAELDETDEVPELTLSKQLTPKDSPFTVAILQYEEDKQFADRVLAAVQLQEVPPRNVVIATRGTDPLRMWKRMLPRIDTPWIVRIDGNVRLSTNALRTMMVTTTSEHVGAVAFNTRSILLGAHFTQHYSMSKVFVYRTDALRKAIEVPRVPHCFASEVIAKHTHYAIVEPFSRTFTPGKASPDVGDVWEQHMTLVGRSLIAEDPASVYRTGYRFGLLCHYRNLAAYYPDLLTSMARAKHWPARSC